MRRKIILLFLLMLMVNMHYAYSQDLSCDAINFNEIENEIKQLKDKIDSLTKYSTVDTTAKYRILFKEQRGETQTLPKVSWLKNECLQKYTSADNIVFSKIFDIIKERFGKYLGLLSCTNYGNKYLVISYFEYYTGNQTSWRDTFTFYFQKL